MTTFAEYLGELAAYYAKPGYGELLMFILGAFMAIAFAIIVETIAATMRSKKKPTDERVRIRPRAFSCVWAPCESSDCAEFGPSDCPDRGRFS